MINLDWNKILTVSVDDLTEQDKDDLYDNVLWYEIEPERSKEHINALFRITQEILKYKGEQVMHKIFVLKLKFHVGNFLSKLFGNL